MKYSNRTIVIVVLLVLITVAATTWIVAQTATYTYHACVKEDGKYRTNGASSEAELGN